MSLHPCVESSITPRWFVRGAIRPSRAADLLVEENVGKSLRPYHPPAFGSSDESLLNCGP